MSGVVTHPAPPPLSASALSWREKISYGVADMGFNFYWANIATFLMIFYTDVFGISAAAAGSMLFAIKIINAFTDPMIGAVADRTKTRFGKFRPYLVWMALPLAAAGVLTYTTPNLEPGRKADLGLRHLSVHDGVLHRHQYSLQRALGRDVERPAGALHHQRPALHLRVRRQHAGDGGHAVPGEMAGRRERAAGLAVDHGVLGRGGVGHLPGDVLQHPRAHRAAAGPEDATSRRTSKTWPDNGPWMVLFFLALIIMITITLRTSTAAYYFKYYVERPELMARVRAGLHGGRGRRRIAHAGADPVHRQEDGC